MSTIVAVSATLPEHRATQAEITAELAPLITRTPGERAVLERMHGASGIATRHTALPLEQYRELRSSGEANDHFIRCAVPLAADAVRTALTAARLRAEEVDFILFTSVTGIAAPSIDALLVPLLGFRPDVKRMPSFGLGCVAGAAGLARVHDYLLGHPTGVGLLISVELCSLTLQRQDATMANFVATGLFGDGAAAAVLVGAEHRLATVPAGAGRGGTPRIMDARSHLYPDSSTAIGWHVGGGGFEILLTTQVAALIEHHLPGDLAGLLGEHGLTSGDIEAWYAHPGGPRILEAFEHSLGLDDGELAASHALLSRVGNLSSASVLHLLAGDLIRPAGSHGLVLALGPGVSAEAVLLEWPA